MCGRFVVASSPTLLAEHFVVDEIAEDAVAIPEYNIAPRADVWIVRERPATTTVPDTKRVLSRVRWGLVPSWAGDPAMGDRLINARGETLAQKPAYRRAFERRRCIVPADGFYEWAPAQEARTHGSPASGRPRKQPWFIRRRDGEPLAFAGLWEVWKAPDEQAESVPTPDGWLRSCVIVTTHANELLAPVHDRMPVVLPARAWDQWLDPGVRDVDELRSLLVPAPEDLLELYPVGFAVGASSAQGPELVDPIGPVLASEAVIPSE